MAKYLTAILLLLSVSCNNSQGLKEESKNTVDIEIKLAMQVMDAMGGQDAWDGTDYIFWNFFGRRDHVWDKSTGNVRIESRSDSVIISMNINDKVGKVSRNFEVLDNPDSINKYLDLGWRYWVNDSYWLVMPFKLLDPGVKLRYLGDSTLQDNRKVNLMEMRFENTGVTPENKYVIYIDNDSKLIVQWDYYRTADLDTPDFSNPWADYTKHAEIMLSGNRGRGQLKKIKVADSVPSNLFEDLSDFVL